MKTTITVICENTVGTPLPIIGEHGQSLFIQDGSITLYDTGQGLGLLNNMKLMGKDPNLIDRIILSHGHYDHTGGLMDLLVNRVSEVSIYCHRDAFKEKIALYEMPGKNIEVPIGTRFSVEDYEKAGARFCWTEGYAEVSGMKVLSDVNRPVGWKTSDARLKQKEAGEIVDDPFNDDLSLLLMTDSGPVVLLGCAHAGIVEILDDFSNKTGVKEFHAVIGGTHLESAPDDYFQKAIDSLEKFNVQKIGTSHCTGFRRSAALAAHFKDRFVPVSAGLVIEF
ncbi:MAG: MBL fold metallo-hydrolase [Spirochaetota bacterium]|jgi:7,8-dihydropterin-6-yl-methyl-4-(beta-D-ribofuranosyl)aminobenzene 5'-phosphate synthase